MMNLEQALASLLAEVNPIDTQDTVPLFHAHRRVLAQDQSSSVDVPSNDLSAMDGYAINLAQVEPHTRYPISQRIAAGHPASGSLQAQSAARLFTGSVIPQGADTVIIQENCRSVDTAVEFLQLPEQGANIRRRGQDITTGSTVVHAGHRLRAQDLGLLASVGIQQVPCFRPLKIGVLSSGDELVEPGAPLTNGKIYNANRFTLKGLINSLQMEFVDIGHVEDTLAATVKILAHAADGVDVIVTTGGVSVGEEDHVRKAVETVGRLNLWKLAIKPGKPLAYGTIAETPFFGLPGNPVAVFVTFLVVVRPYLLSMQGQRDLFVEPIELRCDFSRDKVSPRQEYLRVRMTEGKVLPFHSQDSGILSSTHWANGLAIIPPQTKINAGDTINVLPLDAFNI